MKLVRYLVRDQLWYNAFDTQSDSITGPVEIDVVIKVKDQLEDILGRHGGGPLFKYQIRRHLYEKR